MTFQSLTHSRLWMNLGGLALLSCITLASFPAWSDESPAQQLKAIQNEISHLKRSAQSKKQALAETEALLDKVQNNLNRQYQAYNKLSYKLKKSQALLRKAKNESRRAKSNLAHQRAEMERIAGKGFIILKQENRYPWDARGPLSELYKAYLAAQKKAIERYQTKYHAYRLGVRMLERQTTAVRKDTRAINQTLSSLKQAKSAKSSLNKRLHRQINSLGLKIQAKESEAARLEKIISALQRQLKQGGYPGRGFSKLKGLLPRPVKGVTLRSFGYRESKGLPPLSGQLISAKPGEIVRSVAPGRVLYSDYLRGFGYLIALDHGEGYLTLYGYNDAVLVRKGQNISQGQALAYAGHSTDYPGVSFFGLRKGKHYLDPKGWFRR